MKNILPVLVFFTLISTKVFCMEITWDTLIPRQTIVWEERFERNGWSMFPMESGLLKNLAEKERTSLREIIAIVDQSMETYNQIKPGYLNDPKCRGFNFRSALIKDILYTYVEVRRFLFKQDSQRFDNILDHDEKSKDFMVLK